MRGAKKFFGILSLVILIFILLWTLIFFIFPAIFELDLKGYCGDGTYQGRCSSMKPYFCLNESLIENPSYCGCSKNFSLSDGKCISQFQTGEKEIKLDYILNGENKSFDLGVYTGVVDYLSKVNRYITYENSSYSRDDFELKAVNEPLQEQFLFPLVASIENKGNNLDERTEIAISMIQLFEYKNSSKFIDFYGTKIEYARYPYEVLYYRQGICGEKSQLLAFILKKLGYEVVLIYFPNENHEGVGVKCHSGDFRNTGYCYIETTSVFPIGVDPRDVVGTGTFNDYNIIKVSTGKSLD